MVRTFFGCFVFCTAHILRSGVIGTCTAKDWTPLRRVFALLL